MKKYIVAHLNAHNNELTQTLVESNSEVAACFKYLAEYYDIVFEENEFDTNLTLESFMVRMFDMDTCMSVYTLE